MSDFLENIDERVNGDLDMRFIDDNVMDKDEKDDLDGKFTDEVTISSQDSEDSRLTAYQELESVLDKLGHFGRFQKVLYFGLWLPASCMAAGAYASIYMEWSPTFVCTDFATPHLTSSNKDSCFRLDNTTACSSFAYDSSLFTASVVTEFDLVCDRAYIQTLSKTVYMLGMLIGSFGFGWFGDHFGRRNAFLASSLFLSLGSISSALSFTIEAYITSRFLTSCGGMGLFITCFVLSMEFIGGKARTMSGVAMQVPFAIGQLYMVLIAYFIRDWRLIQTALAASFLLIPLYLFFLPESIRWLIARGRNHEANAVITRIASINKVIALEIKAEENSIQETTKDEKSDGIVSIITNSKLRLRFVTMAVNWAVATLGYYGLGLSSATLTSDPFLSFALSAATEIPGYLSCLFSLDWFGRRRILAFSQMLTGTTCILAAILPADCKLTILLLTLAGKFGASAAFSIVYVYTAEMFHTPVRNSAIGLCSTSARIGGLLAPTIASLSTTDPLLPFLIMGCCCCLGGLGVFVLPETSGEQLPDTLEDAVAIGMKAKSRGFREVRSTEEDLLSRT